MWPLWAFVALLFLFHSTELACAVWLMPTWSFKSLLLSGPYLAAMSAGVVEYLLEVRFLPAIKVPWLSALGLGLALLGEAIRKIAMVTAGAAFTHDIQVQKREGHVLVRDGIYRYCRHPGYLGWFIWAVATQLLLVNPVCMALFTFLAWNFFARRVPYEEHTLRRLFGRAYVEYAAATPTWIPGIP